MNRNFKTNIIVATANNNVIGFKNKLPWDYPEDLRYFRNITISQGKKNILLMGYNTWKSINRSLANRLMIVLTTRNLEELKNQEDVRFVSDFNDTLSMIADLLHRPEYNELFVIGGQKVYNYFMENGFIFNRGDLFIINKIYLTRINKDYQGDTFFQQIDSKKYYIESARRSDKYDEITYLVYNRYNADQKHGEMGYLDLVSNVIKNGIHSDDRTGTGTVSLFGTQTKYDLSKGFPLLTTKKMFVRGIIEELLWFLRGDTDNRKLQAKGVHIWDGNTSREFLDNLGFRDREEGDGGPIYGFNFRHYGADYIDCNTDYRNRGIDQVKEALRLIREEPSSRRIIINLWDPTKLSEMVLPPCHMVYQFRVYNNRLSCMLYQRSGDIGLGVPFNIASASLMTHLFAHLSGLETGELIHTIADAHIYSDHIEVLKEQLEREPYAFPILKIADRDQKEIEDFEFEDFQILGYESHPILKMKMAV